MGTNQVKVKYLCPKGIGADHAEGQYDRHEDRGRNSQILHHLLREKDAADEHGKGGQHEDSRDLRDEVGMLDGDHRAWGNVMNHERFQEAWLPADFLHSKSEKRYDCPPIQALFRSHRR